MTLAFATEGVWLSSTRFVSLDGYLRCINVEDVDVVIMRADGKHLHVWRVTHALDPLFGIGQLLDNVVKLN